MNYIRRSRSLAFWLLTQPPNIVGFGLQLGWRSVDFGFTWPFQKDDCGIRWPFFNGQTALWGAIRWNS